MLSCVPFVTTRLLIGSCLKGRSGERRFGLDGHPSCRLDKSDRRLPFLPLEMSFSILVQRTSHSAILCTM